MDGNTIFKEYKKEVGDEKVTPYKDADGFSIVRMYPSKNKCFSKTQRIFIQIVNSEHGIVYNVNMTELLTDGDETEYSIVGEGKHKNKVTNYYSDRADCEFRFDSSKNIVIHQKTQKEFSANEFVEILVSNHLADRLCWKRKLNWVAAKTLQIFFWLSDKQYEKTKVSLDIYHYKKGEGKINTEQKNIEPFFKYFYISKNIVIVILLVSLVLGIFFQEKWMYGDFTLSNPVLILLFFIILFLCEKLSILLDKMIKDFLQQQETPYYERKVNLIERIHNYQFRNKFDLKIDIKHAQTQK